MLGRNRAVESIHRVEHQRVDLVFMVTQKGCAIRPLGCLHVVVQVAIPQMTKIDQTHAGYRLLQQSVGDAHKLRDA